jgi:hypothetical protein
MASSWASPAVRLSRIHALKTSCSASSGFGTRYGARPAAVSAFFDQTGSIWAKGELIGKVRPAALRPDWALH